MNLTAITKNPDVIEFILVYDDGSKLFWNPGNPRVLRDKDHMVNLMGGARFDAWEAYRDHQPSPGGLCCIHARQEKHCVCIQYTQCIIHGDFHYGTHD